MHYLALVGELPIPMSLRQLPGITDLQFITTKTTKAIANRLEGIVKSDNALKRICFHEYFLVDAYQMGET